MLKNLAVNHVTTWSSKCTRSAVPLYRRCYFSSHFVNTFSWNIFPVYRHLFFSFFFCEDLNQKCLSAMSAPAYPAAPHNNNHNNNSSILHQRLRNIPEPSNPGIVNPMQFPAATGQMVQKIEQFFARIFLFILISCLVLDFRVASKCTTNNNNIIISCSSTSNSSSSSTSNSSNSSNSNSKDHHSVNPLLQCMASIPSPLQTSKISAIINRDFHLVDSGRDVECIINHNRRPRSVHPCEHLLLLLLRERRLLWSTLNHRPCRSSRLILRHRKDRRNRWFHTFVTVKV